MHTPFTKVAIIAFAAGCRAASSMTSTSRKIR